MKLAFAGKGGVGKTTLTAWVADYLAAQGEDVWLVDADTALSLGQASGLSREALPDPLIRRDDLIRERIGSGMLHLNPDVSDLPESIAVDLPLGRPPRQDITPGKKRLLVMGSVSGAGGGCACEANALLKAMLANLIIERNEWVLVDLEAGVEHLGRGTVASADGLVVVSEPSRRGLDTAADVAKLGRELGLANQALVLNRAEPTDIPRINGLPERTLFMPELPELKARQLSDPAVVGLADHTQPDEIANKLLNALGRQV
ncbi:ATP-binding protein [Salidesulfovibrio brasiliensis]|uniref:ATP-binding protein n=1 Tax=Salidesulfovibrio brasiliensis TaxID=221711 RepID=UPI0006D0F10C|nr:AAA family ATPase [Salidesulfovibrio brasiliensis]